MKRTTGRHGVSPEMFASSGSETSGSSPASGHRPSRPVSGRLSELVTQFEPSVNISSPKKKVKRSSLGGSASFETGESSRHKTVRRLEGRVLSPVSGHPPSRPDSGRIGEYVVQRQSAADIGSPKRKVKRPTFGFSASFETGESSRHKIVRSSEGSSPSPVSAHQPTPLESRRRSEHVAQAQSLAEIGSPKRKVRRPSLGFSASFETSESRRHDFMGASESSGSSPASGHLPSSPESGRLSELVTQFESSVNISSPKRKVKRPSLRFYASFEASESSCHKTVRRLQGRGTSPTLGHPPTLPESGSTGQYVAQAQSLADIGSPKTKVKRPTLGFSASFETGEFSRHVTAIRSVGSGQSPAPRHQSAPPESRRSGSSGEFNPDAGELQEQSGSRDRSHFSSAQPSLSFCSTHGRIYEETPSQAGRSDEPLAAPEIESQPLKRITRPVSHESLSLAISQLNLEVSSPEIDDCWHIDASALAAAFYVPGLGNISPPSSDNPATVLQTAEEDGGSLSSLFQEQDCSLSTSFSELLSSTRYTHSGSALLPSRGRRLKTLQGPPEVLVPEPQEECTLRRRRAVEENESKSRALRDGSFYNFQLRMDANEYPIKTMPKCPCNVIRHPSSWSVELIVQVHDYSSLLNLRDQIRITKDLIVLMNDEESSVVCEVPMVQDNPFKKKVEEVFRYIDVETEVGDMTVFDLNYYSQPLDRKIFVMVSGHRVEGLVVAEPLESAHRIRTEIPEGYRELEVTPTPVRVGINRIWVHVSRRRERWATMLCDLVRYKFIEGEILERTDVAFNIGTDSGMSFAKVYLKTASVPLYPGVTGTRQIIEPQHYETR